MGSKAPFFF